MRLIAIHTIHAQSLVKAAEPAKAGDKARYAPAILAPRTVFDPADYGIDADEARSLVEAGAARERGHFDGPGSTPATDVTLHPPAGGGDLPSDEELEAMTRADLDALAAKRGVDVSKAKNKGDVIDALIASVE